MKITGKASIDLGKYRNSIKKRVEKMKTAAGDKIAARLVEEVDERIPNDGGWFKIYKDALRFNHEDDTWTVLGESDIELTQVPAATSLVNFSGRTASAAALSTFNPYPVDTIPPINGGITGNVTVVPASETEVMSHRERHASIQEQVKLAITRQGLSVTWAKRPIINGQVKADLKFLSKRLEHGLGGFPRVRHWSLAAGEAKRSAARWVRDDAQVMKDIEDAFKA